MKLFSKTIILLIAIFFYGYSEDNQKGNSMNQKIRDLNEIELSEIDSNINIGMNIMAHYGVDEKLSIYEKLDNVYEMWLNDIGERPAPGEIIIGLGSILGNRISNKHNVKWKSVVDNYGESFMLIINSYQIYPLDFVAKRVAKINDPDPEIGFFNGLNKIIDEKFIDMTAAQQGDAPEPASPAR
jgi:hypothetical protein